MSTRLTNEMRDPTHNVPLIGWQENFFNEKRVFIINAFLTSLHTASWFSDGPVMMSVLRCIDQFGRISFILQYSRWGVSDQIQ